MKRTFKKSMFVGFLLFAAIDSLGLSEVFADDIREMYADTEIMPVDYSNSLNAMIGVEMNAEEEVVTDAGISFKSIEDEALAREAEAEAKEQELAEKKLKEMEEEIKAYEEERAGLLKKIRKLEAEKVKREKEEAEEAERKKKEAEEAKKAEVEKKKKAEKKQSKTTKYDKDLKVSYSEEDKDILRKIIAAEAGDQGYQGMEYVAEVIRNRCVRYKKSVYDVVFSPHQFSPVSNGTYYTAYGKLTDSEKEDVEKAIEAIEDGAYEAQGAMFFKMYGYHDGCTDLFKYKDHYFSK